MTLRPLQRILHCWQHELQQRLRMAIARDKPLAASLWLWMGAEAEAPGPAPYDNEWGTPSVDLSHPIEHGWRLVHMAAAHNAWRTLPVLARAGASLDGPSTTTGATPLLVAAWYGHEESMDTLEALGADPMAWAPSLAEAEHLMRTQDSTVVERWRVRRAKREASHLSRQLPCSVARQDSRERHGDAARPRL